MITIIAGGRNIENYAWLLMAIRESGFEITKVVSGGARGADKLGERWARVNGVPVEVFEAEWDKYGNSAGPIRNEKMGRVGEALIALWDGKSRGTKHMIDTANRLKLRVFVFRVDKL